MRNMRLIRFLPLPASHCSESHVPADASLFLAALSDVIELVWACDAAAARPGEGRLMQRCSVGKNSSSLHIQPCPCSLENCHC